MVSTDDRRVDVPLSANIAQATHPIVSISPRRVVLVLGGPKSAGEREDNLLTVTNTGDGPLDIQSYTSTLPEQFLVSPNEAGRPCSKGMQLGPKDWCQLRVDFRPRKSASQEANLELYDNADNSPQRVPLYVRMIAPQSGSLVVGEFNPNFGQVPVFGYQSGYQKGTRVPEMRSAVSAGPSLQVQLKNGGPGSLTILSFSPLDDPDFELDTADCAGQTFAPYAGCQITITFKPHSIRTHSTSVTITHNGTGGSRTLTFQGEGVNPYPVVRRPPIDVLKRTRPQTQPAEQPQIR